MTELYFQRFSSEPTYVEPYGEIGQGIKLCYDEAALSRWATASARISRSFDEFGNPAKYIVVDGVNFANENFFAVEVYMPDGAARMEMRLRAYPFTYIRQRIYFDDGQNDNFVDMPGVHADDSFFSITHYREDLYRQQGVPRNAERVRVNLFIPQSEWFSFGIMSVRASRRG